MDRRGFVKSCASAAAAFAGQQDEATRGEIQQAQYVIVEMMGYKKLAGRIQQGPIPGLLQLDVPVEGGYVSQFINPSAIYRMTIAGESAVREIAKNVDPLPVIELDPRLVQRGIQWGEDEDDWHR